MFRTAATTLHIMAKLGEPSSLRKNIPELIETNDVRCPDPGKAKEMAELIWKIKGEGYFRLTAFGDAEKTKVAAERIKAAIKAL